MNITNGYLRIFIITIFNVLFTADEVCGLCSSTPGIKMFNRDQKRLCLRVFVYYVNQQIFPRAIVNYSQNPDFIVGCVMIMGE